MISNPKKGQRVQIWYAVTPKRIGERAPSEYMPHHAAVGRVTISGRGRPRNHGVLLDTGEFVAIPAGNLRKVQ